MLESVTNLFLKDIIPDTTSIKSFTAQTGWESGLYGFGLAEKPGIDFFNPGLLRKPDGLWLVARRSKWTPGLHFGMNDCIAFSLHGNSPVRGVPIRMERRFPDEQFEDPRAVYHNGKIFLSCCDFVWTNRGWSGAHQIICELDPSWNFIRRFDPDYANNGVTVGKNIGHEKNWIWFFLDNKPHLIYSGNPHVVCRFTNDFKLDEQYVTEHIQIPWLHGDIRGGTPPVLIDGQYWTFFHSSTEWIKPKRQYHMGAYSFESSPPFRITRITTAPLLSGSKEDPWKPGKPLVIFPCGSDFRDGKWLISMGINDLKCGWISIPHQELLNRTMALDHKTIPLKSMALSAIRKVCRTKIKLPDVTLACVDDRKPDLAKRAIAENTNKIQFGAVKFFTSDKNIPDAIPVKPIKTLEEYSRFMIKDLCEHVNTSHVLVSQWDGYVINASAWRDEWLGYDYIGSVWEDQNAVGNGGFSLRSKKLLEALQAEFFKGPFFPEDDYICKQKRTILEKKFNIRFAPWWVAKEMSVESGLYRKQFGFHSFLTKLPDDAERPYIFHHSGDLGDIIYGMAAMKAAGGGVLFLSPNVETRVKMTSEVAANIIPLLNIQPYVWKAQYTGLYPSSVDYDLDNFRNTLMGHENSGSIFQHSLDAIKVKYPQDRAWLISDLQVRVPGKDIAVSRSIRYHNPGFPWIELMERFNKRVLFLGSEEERDAFVHEFGVVDYMATKTLLDAARVISGARVFLGNQSCLMAIALGLGVRVVQEAWPQDANCILKRPSAAYFNDPESKLVIPSGWI